MGKGSSSSPKCPDWFWGPPTFLFIGHQGSFPGVKQLGSEVKHSSTSTAEVENEWIYNSTPPICLHVMDRENFTFFYDILYTYIHLREVMDKEW
jgi:hypothetical protein